MLRILFFNVAQPAFNNIHFLQQYTLK